jgi:MFS family permease
VIIIWIAFFINFLFGAFEVGYSYILIEKLKMASRSFGFTQGSFAIGMLLFSIYFSIRKEVKFPLLLSKRAIIAMGTIMGTMGLPLWLKMSTSMVFVYYMVMMFSFGASLILVNTPINVMMQKQVDDDYKGRVFSILETMATGLMPLGMLLYGFLYDVFPAQWIMLLSAALFIGVVLVLARPSIIRKVYPELDRGKAVKGDVEVSS